MEFILLVNLLITLNIESALQLKLKVWVSIYNILCYFKLKIYHYKTTHKINNHMELQTSRVEIPISLKY